MGLKMKPLTSKQPPPRSEAPSVQGLHFEKFLKVSHWAAP